jgi:hypothetical protein
MEKYSSNEKSPISSKAWKSPEGRKAYGYELRDFHLLAFMPSVLTEPKKISREWR